MLNERQIEIIKRALDDRAGDYYNTENREVRERCRGYAQGVAFVLSQIGYAVEWEDGKAIIVNEG